ncbi:MAG: hypothetical protein LUG49_00005 [Oscillospiraceae bacterium]|nr:hypothetical protein [Oscillospiraceae bacterium]
MNCIYESFLKADREGANIIFFFLNNDGFTVVYDNQDIFNNYIQGSKDKTSGIKRIVGIKYQNLVRNSAKRQLVPYGALLKDSHRENIEDLKSELSNELQNLDINSLLFAKSLKAVSYKINTDSLMIEKIFAVDRQQVNDHCSVIRHFNGTMSDVETSKDDSYLVFSQQAGNQSPVDVAFRVSNTDDGKYEFKEVRNSNIFVSFPTNTRSRLNFIVSGLYHISEDCKVLANDEYNKKLAEQTAELLCDSVRELREQGILNYSLINVLPVDESVFKGYSLFKVMYDKMYELFSKEDYLPCKEGGYTSSKTAKIFEDAEFSEVFTDEVLSELFSDGKSYHWLALPSLELEHYKNANQFITGSLNIKVLTPSSLRIPLRNNKDFLSSRTDEWLVRFYNLKCMREKILFSYKNAGHNISSVDFIKTSSGKFVQLYKSAGSTELNVYTPSDVRVANADVNVVDEKIFKECKGFFINTLGLQKVPGHMCESIKRTEHKESDYFTYLKSKIIINNKSIPSVTEHIRDLKELLFYAKQHVAHDWEISSLLINSAYIRCRTIGHSKYIILGDGNTSRINDVYFSSCHDGSIESYFYGVRDYTYVDIDFYRDNLSSDELSYFIHLLKMAGISDNLSDGYSDVLPFQEDFTIKCLCEVLDFIQYKPSSSNSAEKSLFIFKFINRNRFLISQDPRSHEIEPEYARILLELNPDLPDYYDVIQKQRKRPKWLYTKDNKLVSADEITCLELNPELYGNVNPKSKLYSILGFKPVESSMAIPTNSENQESPVDTTTDIVESKQTSESFEQESQRRYGISASELDKIVHLYSAESKEESSVIEQDFEEDFDFPESDKPNWDTLHRHSEKLLSEASPVEYREVWRRERVSKPVDEVQAYVKHIYRSYRSSKVACQMCHCACDNVEACQIEKEPEKELSPMYLCLCPNCAAKFRGMRQYGADILMNKISGLSRADIEKQSPVEINFMQEKLWFTQTHIAEIRELLLLRKMKT